MSADLLAEFGNGVPISGSDKPAESGSQIKPDNTMFGGDGDDDDDDEFDSFVDPEPAHPDQQDFNLTTPNSIAHTGSNTTVASVYTSKEDLWLPSEPGGELLFDASLEASVNEEDDWGEFEAASNTPGHQLIDLGEDEQAAVTSHATSNQIASKQNTSNTPALLDLLSLDDSLTVNPATTPRDVAPQKSSQATPKTKVGQTISTKQAASKAPSTEDDFFAEWDDFKDGHEGVSRPSVNSKHLKSRESTLATSNQIKQDNTGVLREPQRMPVQEADVRPINIPPPSIILQLFPSVLEGLREEVNQSKRKSTTPSTDRIIILISTLKTASRVVAGRASRWKRDIRLSQSMKIGPARSGKTSGMKLNSVNKGESIKEEQEVVAVIESWRNHTAVFNSLIQSSGGRPIPVITDKTRINTAGPEDGALKASHACALCGLKRDERLPKVDEDVQDSFGEWWAEHWGHTDCKRFWEANSKHLHQR